MPPLFQLRLVLGMAVGLCLAATACKPPTPDDSPPDPGCFPPTRSAYTGLFVLNEGEWQLNTATLSYYDTQNPGCQLAECLFRHVNGDQPLGDVAQAVLREADTLYIVMNGSARLYKLQLPSFRLLATLNLPSGASPRQLVLSDTPGQAWLTSLTNATVYGIHLPTLSVNHTVTVEPYPEGAVFAAGKVFVACGNYPGGQNHKLAVVDPSALTVDYIPLPAGNPGSLLLLPNGSLAVECRGNYYQPDSAAIALLNPFTYQIDTLIKLPGKTFGRMVLHDHQFLLITLGSEDYNELTVASLHVPSRALVPGFITRQTLGIGATEVMYGLASRQYPQRRIYITTYRAALNGTLHELDSQLNVLATRPTGVFPGTVFWVD